MIAIPGRRFVNVADDVKLGRNVTIFEFVNLYGCEIGDESRIGAFVEIQRDVVVGRRVRIQSHTFICSGVRIEDQVFVGHNVTFINDRYPTAEGAETGRWTLEPTRERACVDRVRGRDSVRPDDRRGRADWGGRRRHARRGAWRNGRGRSGQGRRAVIPLVNLNRQHEQIARDLDAAVKDVRLHGDFILGRAVAVSKRRLRSMSASATALASPAVPMPSISSCERSASAGATKSSCRRIRSLRRPRRCGAAARIQSSSIATKRPRRWTPMPSLARSPPGRKRWCPCICTVSRRTWIRCSPLRASIMCPSSKTRPRPTARRTVAGHAVRLASPRASASTRARTWAHGADGGAVTTNDDGLADAVRSLRNLGSSIKYVHTRMGFNSRLDTLQAAVLGVKLPLLNRWNGRRNDVAARYHEAFDRCAPRVRVMRRASGTTRHAYHLFVIR